MGPEPYVRTTHNVYDDALFHLIAYLEKNYYTYLRTSILNCSQIVTSRQKMVRDDFGTKTFQFRYWKKNGVQYRNWNGDELGTNIYIVWYG